MAQTSLRLNIMIVDTRDTTTLGVADISVYPTNFTPVNPSLEITPGQFAKVNVDFTPSSVNVYDSNDLGITCDETCGSPLPDGIYKFKYSVDNGRAGDPCSTGFIEKTFMRADAIMCKYMNAFLKADALCNCQTDYQKALKQELRRIELLIQGSIAAANNCDDQTSWSMYQKADALLTKMKYCKC